MGDRMSRLKERYEREIRPQLMKELGRGNLLEVPRLSKIVLNMGLGEAITNAKVLDSAVAELTAISGQKTSSPRRARQSRISSFARGCRSAVWDAARPADSDFFARLLSLALPRRARFRGLSDRSFDGRGNYSLGVREQIIFPEVDLDKIDKVRGLTVSIITTAKADADGKALLKAMGMPFRA